MRNNLKKTLFVMKYIKFTTPVCCINDENTGGHYYFSELR